MLSKLSTLALVLPLVSALTINPLQGATTAGTVQVTWTASTQDPPYFSIELVNQAFHNTYAIANNVQTSLGSLTVTLPQVPPDVSYSIEAIATNNVNDVLSQSGQFAINAASSSLTTADSTTATSATDSTSSVSATSVTPLATSSTPASAIPSTFTVASSSTASSSTPSTFSSSGTASLKLTGIAPAAALVLSAVAGAAMVF